MKIDENMTFLDSSIQYLIREKVEYLVRKIPKLEYIVLFGSYARMEQTVKSDIDLVFYDLNIFRESDCLFISQIKRKGLYYGDKNKFILWYGLQ